MQTIYQSECGSPQRNGEEVLRAVLQSAMTVLRKKKESQDKKKNKTPKDGNATDSDEEQQGTVTPYLTSLIRDYQFHIILRYIKTYSQT